MAEKTDRLSELIEGVRRNLRPLQTPEGVPFAIQAAGHLERLTAFTVDLLIMFTVIVLLYLGMIPLFFSDVNLSLGMTVILFLAFIVRNAYFLHFELTWQGRTPGKRVCNLRVINRSGGELTPSAVIARNLTREVEFFLPLSLIFSVSLVSNAVWQDLCLLGWVLAISLTPFFNRDHLRCGDLIGGTQVIAMPKRRLLGDLSIAAAIPPEEPAQKPLPEAPADPPETPPAPTRAALEPQAAPEAESARPAYVFSPEQLSIYGAFELQVLEEFLRRPPHANTDQLLAETCARIRRKIGWAGEVPASETRRFLTDFYTAERAELERGQLFGRRREDQHAGPAKGRK